MFVYSMFVCSCNQQIILLWLTGEWHVTSTSDIRATIRNKHILVGLLYKNSCSYHWTLAVTPLLFILVNNKDQRAARAHRTERRINQTPFRAPGLGCGSGEQAALLCLGSLKRYFFFFLSWRTNEWRKKTETPFSHHAAATICGCEDKKISISPPLWRKMYAERVCSKIIKRHVNLQ